MHPDALATATSTGQAAALRGLTHALYAMHLLSWASLGLLSVVAMVINHRKRGALPDRFYRSHFRWQARSFWFTLLGLLVAAPLLLLFVFAGYVAWLVVGLWYLYRFIRGWWAFAEHRPMPMPADS
ncbi:MAG: hypothetical protein JNJ89_09440 [Rubrivivax sp.]|nr:hypothetical protein [Rubrivivax sp.]